MTGGLFRYQSCSFSPNLRVLQLISSSSSRFLVIIFCGISHTVLYKGLYMFLAIHVQAGHQISQGDAGLGMNRRPPSLLEDGSFEIPEFLRKKGRSRYPRAWVSIWLVCSDFMVKFSVARATPEIYALINHFFMFLVHRFWLMMMKSVKPGPRGSKVWIYHLNNNHTQWWNTPERLYSRISYYEHNRWTSLCICLLRVWYPPG